MSEEIQVVINPNDAVTNRLIILTAEVKYPSSQNSYLTSNSYYVRNMQDLENALNDFRNTLEQDEFKVINLVAYAVPKEQIKQAIEYVDL